MPITNDLNITGRFLRTSSACLHHDGLARVFGPDMIRVPAADGYVLSPGALFPFEYILAREGSFVSHKEAADGNVKKLRPLTKACQMAFAKSIKSSGMDG